MTLRLGWFSTRGQSSRPMYAAVVDAIDGGELDAKLAFVFSNREPGEDAVSDEFFEVVRGRGHTLVTRSSTRYRRSVRGALSRAGEPLPAWRADYDGLIERDLESHPFELGVLAGYMLIFTPAFVACHPVLNLHPALPGGPVGTWRQVVRSLIRARAAASGVMAHLAIAAVDAGPVAAFCRYPLHGPALEPLWRSIEGEIEQLSDEELEESALFAAIRAAGVRYEAPLLLAALAEFAAGRLRAEPARVVGAGGAASEPVDLTEQVESRLRVDGGGWGLAAPQPAR